MLISKAVFARVAPFALFIAFIAMPHGPWLTVARGVTVAVVLAILWRSYSELRAAPKLMADWVFAVGIGFAVFFAWIHLDHGWMTFGESGPGFDPRRMDGGIDWALAGLRLFGLALAVPVMEELFWRSLVMRWIDKRDFLALEPKRVSWVAFVISSALFATEHSLWLAGLLAGLAYAWVYVRSGNLWMPIVSHAVTNATLGVWILATGNWRYW